MQNVLCSIPKPLELGAGSQLMLKYPTAATQVTNPSGNGTVLQLWWWNCFVSCYTGKASMTLWNVREWHRASQGAKLGTFNRREILLCVSSPQTLLWLASTHTATLPAPQEGKFGWDLWKALLTVSEVFLFPCLERINLFIGMIRLFISVLPLALGNESPGLTCGCRNATVNFGVLFYLLSPRVPMSPCLSLY